MNELVILTIHFAKVMKDIIEVLAIDILSLFSNQHNSHVLEIRTSALGKVANSNSVDLLVGFHSRLKQDYGSKSKERKNSDTKDRSFDVASALPLVAMLSRQGICILPNGLAIPSCRINVRIGQARPGQGDQRQVPQEIGQYEQTPR